MVFYIFQSVQEQRFDHISAVYHLLNDTSIERSNSSSSIANESSQSQISGPAAVWPGLSDSQHLEKVNKVFAPNTHLAFEINSFLFSLPTWNWMIRPKARLRAPPMERTSKISNEIWPHVDTQSALVKQHTIK